MCEWTGGARGDGKFFFRKIVVVYVCLGNWTDESVQIVAGCVCHV